MSTSMGAVLGDEQSSGERWAPRSQAFAAHRHPSEDVPLVQRRVDAIGVDHVALPASGVRAAPAA